MTKYQKGFIMMTLIIVLPMIFLIYRSIFGNGVGSVFYYVLGITSLHWVFFLIRAKSNNRIKWIIYIPAIFFGIITLFFTGIAIINAGNACDPLDDGCMNEDYTFVFAIIGFVIMILSFVYSFLFKYLWFKKEIQEI